MGLILVDTSIWVDHIRQPLPRLVDLIRSRRCVLHPYVLVEIALGNLQYWSRRVAQLRALPSVEPISNDDLLVLVDESDLQGSGLGFVDAHLVGSCRSVRDARLWSRDKKLVAIASALGLAWTEADEAP